MNEELIILMGPVFAGLRGKTTVGKLLVEALGRPFVSLERLEHDPYRQLYNL